MVFHRSLSDSNSPYVSRTAKSTVLQILYFLLIIIRFGLLAKIRRFVCMSKSQKSLCVSFSRTNAGLCIYYLFVWSDLNFLHISLWITLPTQSCLVLYSFCTNLLHLLIMWLMVSSLSPHNLHLLFCCILSILTLIWLILMALFCAVSLLKFPFLSQVLVFSCEMLFISCLKCHWDVFLPILFLTYCHSVVHCVVSIISDDCKQTVYSHQKWYWQHNVCFSM